ncbi:MAG: aldehyde dehydrogenase family protein, partial [Myxococcota bacterium]
SLVTDDRVDAVILTGAYETARMFLSWKPTLRLFAETSGKNAMIVTALADRDQTVKDLVKSAFGHAGQKCSVASLGILEAEVYDDAVEAIEELDALPDVVVLGNADWHAGVVGIVASKLVERYDRPTILVGEGGRGSGRTARGLHLYDAMSDCQQHLVKFGGHQAAAGLRMRFEDLDAFRQDMELRVRADPRYGEVTESRLDYDDDLDPREVGFEAFNGLRRLEPFGNGNPQPVFRIPELRVRTARLVGQDHLKLRLEGSERLVAGIAFKMGDRLEDCAPGAAMTVVACLELNEFQGYESIELRIRDLAPADADAERG